MMDITALAKELATFLTPFLPYLVKAGEQAAGEAGKTFTAEAWENAKSLWVKLWAKVKGRPAAQEAAQDVAEHPQDEDAQAALRNQLKKLLSEDDGLANEIARLMESKVVQRVLAESGSTARRVKQHASGHKDVTQEAKAKDHSHVEDIDQDSQ